MQTAETGIISTHLGIWQDAYHFTRFHVSPPAKMPPASKSGGAGHRLRDCCPTDAAILRAESSIRNRVGKISLPRRTRECSQQIQFRCPDPWPSSPEAAA